MTSTVRVLFRFAVASTSFLSGSFHHAAAQSAGEAVTTSEPNLQEPALQLELTPAGVDVVPSPARIVDGYTLEEMDLRVKRARIWLLSMTGVTVAGVALFGPGVAQAARSSQDVAGVGDALSAGPLLISGMVAMIGGAVGMIASGILLGSSKGELRRLKEARHEGPRRVQWDLESSRVVF